MRKNLRIKNIPCELKHNIHDKIGLMGVTYKIVVDIDYERSDEELINVTIEPQHSHCFRYRRLHNNQTVKEALYVLTLTMSTLIRKYHLVLFRRNLFFVKQQ